MASKTKSKTGDGYPRRLDSKEMIISVPAAQSFPASSAEGFALPSQGGFFAQYPARSFPSCLHRRQIIFRQTGHMCMT
jgi:hypothetical protein